MSSSTFSRSDCTSSTCSIAVRRSPGARASPESRSRSRGADDSPRSSGLESRLPPPRPPRPPRRPPRNRGRRESDRRCPSVAAGAAGFSPADSGWPSGCSSGFICLPANFRFSTIKINGINNNTHPAPEPLPGAGHPLSPFGLAVFGHFVLVSNMTLTRLERLFCRHCSAPLAAPCFVPGQAAKAN